MDLNTKEVKNNIENKFKNLKTKNNIMNKLES